MNKINLKQVLVEFLVNQKGYSSKEALNIVNKLFTKKNKI